MKKLENVRRDHKERLIALEKTQNVDKQKAELITRNQELVDNCLLVIQLALANQLPWPNISELVNKATEQGDPVASAIKGLKLNTNQITLLLRFVWNKVFLFFVWNYDCTFQNSVSVNIWLDLIEPNLNKSKYRFGQNQVK